MGWRPGGPGKPVGSEAKKFLFLGSDNFLGCFIKENASPHWLQTLLPSENTAITSFAFDLVWFHSSHRYAFPPYPRDTLLDCFIQFLEKKYGMNEDIQTKENNTFTAHSFLPINLRPNPIQFRN
ncbi:hypothetical protein Pst134EA_003263 [Puccinia striiformis f. sp. tritici]|uniref:hypothetical protein n=1 Tax=Puccinia striiformis f. sp. tritici TaxID=168172 RepID=UPI002008A5B7|nr:hypothetical protein Pst134EA_003263 [Puccinia striiformis f. sp. tritici]KAH9464811.1 hypothetical protein Pst134EB_004320 [Puccinia striiformis f. sp. tritici]KAH9472659.1 hypothetical protein Pst134EA_003263 [Puccinia striiformis f. sp. tritici]